MRIGNVVLDVNGVLVCGNKLAEVFASGEVTEQEYMDMLDYCFEVLLAENSEELLDAMYYCLLEKNIDTKREEEHSVLAAFIAKYDATLWEELCDALDDITEGIF